jgi:quercetin dioxygenase-like cupin family protein
MIIRKLADVPAHSVDMEGVRGATKQLVLGSADGVPNFSFRVFTLEPGGHTPRHSHTTEHLNYILSGHGCLVDQDGERHPLGPGDFAFVPPDQEHQFRNDADGAPFVFLCAVPRQYE